MYNPDVSKIILRNHFQNFSVPSPNGLLKVPQNGPRRSLIVSNYQCVQMSLTEHKVTLSQSVAKQQGVKWPFWCLASMLTISALLYSLDISVEVILWEAVEATIDEYPVFLLYLSQPSIWNTYQRVLFNRSRNGKKIYGTNYKYSISSVLNL